MLVKKSPLSTVGGNWQASVKPNCHRAKLVFSRDTTNSRPFHPFERVFNDGQIMFWMHLQFYLPGVG